MANAGSADGTGGAARFNTPRGLAVDSAGNVYVADTYNYTIRKIEPGGVVTTVAGLAGSSGSADGTGGAARFGGLVIHQPMWTYTSGPYGVAVDNADHVYVADYVNHTIRKIGPGSVVTTVAGLAGSSGSADGTGSAARFYSPWGLAVDRAGNVLVADQYNHTIRKLGPGGVVTTVAGLAGSYGSVDGTGSAARFWIPYSLAADAAGNVYVADDGNPLRKIGPGGVVTTMAGPGVWCVAVDRVGNLYVDNGNAIQKASPELKPAAILMSGPGFAPNSGQFGFSLTGPAGQSVVVEASTDLVQWLPIWTNTFTGTLYFSDSLSGAHSLRFYRAHQQ